MRVLVAQLQTRARLVGSRNEAYIQQKRPIYTEKEAYKHTAKETCIYSKRVLYTHSKRGLYTQQKRPVYTAKEAYTHSKRGLYTQQKRPVYTAKEACISRPAVRASLGFLSPLGLLG